MSAQFPYYRPTFPIELSQWNSAVMEVDVTVKNPADATKIANLTLQFDTGASISLGPRNVATQLGLDWASGIPLTLQGVGGTPFTTYVHVLDAEIPGVSPLVPAGSAWLGVNRPLAYWREIVQAQKASSVKFQLPMAIAEGEDFDLLLGMLGVVDGVAEFLCDNMNGQLYLKETLTKRSFVSPLENIRWRLQSLRP